MTIIKNLKLTPVISVPFVLFFQPLTSETFGTTFSGFRTILPVLESRAAAVVKWLSSSTFCFTGAWLPPLLEFSDEDFFFSGSWRLVAVVCLFRGAFVWMRLPLFTGPFCFVSFPAADLFFPPACFPLPLTPLTVSLAFFAFGANLFEKVPELALDLQSSSVSFNSSSSLRRNATLEVASAGTNSFLPNYPRNSFLRICDRWTLFSYKWLQADQHQRALLLGQPT